MAKAKVLLKELTQLRKQQRLVLKQGVAASQVRTFSDDANADIAMMVAMLSTALETPLESVRGTMEMKGRRQEPGGDDGDWVQKASKGRTSMIIFEAKMEADFRNEAAELEAGFQKEVCERTRVYDDLRNNEEGGEIYETLWLLCCWQCGQCGYGLGSVTFARPPPSLGQYWKGIH